MLIKDLMLASLKTLEEDYSSGLFTHYELWTTPYGVSIASIEQAVNFIPFHEGLHMGTIKAQKKLISNHKQ